jgi:hypothetical protein
MKIKEKVIWENNIECKFDNKNKDKCFLHKLNRYRCDNCLKSNQDLIKDRFKVDEFNRKININNPDEWEGKKDD